MIAAAPQAIQNLLFFLSELGVVAVILSPLNCLIDIESNPFFVFSKRRVGLLQIAELVRFVWRMGRVGEDRFEFVGFRSVLLCSEHLTRPFRGRREIALTYPCPRESSVVSTFSHNGTREKDSGRCRQYGVL